MALLARTTGNNSLSSADNDHVINMGVMIAMKKNSEQDPVAVCVDAEDLNLTSADRYGCESDATRKCYSLEFNKAMPPTECPIPAINNSPTIFLTYVKEEDSWSDIVQLDNYLKKNGIKTRMASKFHEEMMLSVSVNDRLNDNIEQSDFVIVCVNTVYKELTSNPRPEVSNDQKLMQALFVFNQLQTQYISNLSMNYRVLPVLVGGAKYRDLPLFLQNTTVYNWPHDCKQLLSRIFKRQEYEAPEQGPVPKMTIEYC